MKPSLLVVIGLPVCIFIASLMPVGARPVSKLENIHSIPYPVLYEGSSTIAQLVTEPLAHADVALHEPVLGKKLRLKIVYDAIHITSLAVGVREDSFWLSYANRQPICGPPPSQSCTPNFEPEVVLTLPLTDKLQETDRSIDLMFFAEGENPQWALHQLKASVEYDIPPWPQLKNYIRSLVKRERAL